jgi:general secretion pathway protein G
MKKAFTMIELVFVIVILGILASFAIPKLAATRDDAEVLTGVRAVNGLITDIGTYYTSHGLFESNVSQMTNVVLLDSAKNDFTANFKVTPAYFGNTAKSKICLKITADDNNGTLKIEPHSDGSSYCTALIKQADAFLKVHHFGGSAIYK